jgi:hypothetical protein
MSSSNIVTNEDIKNGGYTLVSELNPPEFVNGNKYYFYNNGKFRVGICTKVSNQKDSCDIKFNDGQHDLTPKINKYSAYWRPPRIARSLSTFYGTSLKGKVYKDTDYYGGKRRKRKGKNSTKKRKGKKSTTRRKRRY